MLILLILIVHYCKKKMKTKCLQTIQKFWRVSLTLFPATRICPVYGLKEKHHLEEITSLRLKGCCLVQMPWNCDCDLTKLSSCVVWNVWIMLSGIFLSKCSVCVSAKEDLVALTRQAGFSPFSCVLLTLLWNLTSLEKNNFFVKICTIML